jgi:hypothetical protein
LGNDVGNVSRIHENYQIIDTGSEKPSRLCLKPTVIFTVSGKGIIIQAINKGM